MSVITVGLCLQGLIVFVDFETTNFSLVGRSYDRDFALSLNP